MNQDPEIERIGAVLDSLHVAASKAQGELYFSLFAKDGVFIGTDASERWTLEQFKAYAAPHFNKGKGWTYVAKTRNISVASSKNVAWFDEILESKSYGTSRGTGVLKLEQGLWKIAQYHLTFPIPNELAEKMTQEIKNFERQSKK